MSLTTSLVTTPPPPSTQLNVPYQITSGGATATVQGLVPIAAQALLGVILTALGERVMRPTFGSQADSYVFRSSSAQNRASFISEVRQAITEWIPNLVVTSFNVASPQASTLSFSIDYQVLPSQTVYTAQITTGPILENVTGI